MMTRDYWKHPGGRRSRITPKSRLNAFLGPEPFQSPDVCIDCGHEFDRADDSARCPASLNTAYHRGEEDR